MLSGNRTTVLAPAGTNKALPDETTVGLAQPDTQIFTDFIMELSYPPNPIRNLDNSLTDDQTAGRQLYNNGVVRVQTGIREVCRTCHPVSPGAGLFGTRGFGYNHNGATTSNFIIADLGMPSTDLRQLRSFLFAFPTESPPILGQQVIVTSTSNSANNARLSLLIERAGTTLPIPECDLIAKGVIDDKQRGWLLDVDGLFIPDNSSESPITEEQLLTFASADSPLTFTCAPGVLVSGWELIETWTEYWTAMSDRPFVNHERCEPW